uniref:hypothetical protein n=1 Tax=Ningiella ruwaisensis TaxID=2364274 RepID=UPI00109FE619|nr:hypothetical protein [Ningiella ruwaisensis]
MKHLKYILAAAFASLYVAASNAAIMPVKFEFSQDGFYSYNFDENGLLVQGELLEASISGFFTGKDLDGDGQLYARSRLASDPPLNYGPFGNELITAEVTFSGFGTSAGPQTIVYDKNGTDPFGNPSDMNSLFSAFMGIAYNLDGGPLGDTEDEGVSFSLFAPSTNFTLGSLFSPYWSEPNWLGAANTGVCDGTLFCGAVFEAFPADTPDGARAVAPFYLSTNALQIEQVAVPAPTLFGLLAGVFGGLVLLRQLRNY